MEVTHQTIQAKAKHTILNIQPSSKPIITIKKNNVAIPNTKFLSESKTVIICDLSTIKGHLNQFFFNIFINKRK